MNELMEEDFSKLTARDLLLRQTIELKTLKSDCERQEKSFDEFKRTEFKEVRDDVKLLSEMRFQNVGIWKTVTGISVILGIIATIIALLTHHK